MNKTLSPVSKIIDLHLMPVKNLNQGTGKLGLENHKTETIIDTTKMTSDEKNEYLKKFNK
ncbi:putative structural protein [Erwinia phage pEa_SNUABM_50]|uniref:Uncharacterized protein n=4 Tax=Eneladusvirus BF TaxID=2560751 RepID=A0A1S6UBA2_9CAUD|nr:hypothetical protein FDH34_gp410 [Serratia phage BF]QOI71439.1 putative structural protein [Erwinia phage pEa_SNUABM_12]QOI71984.1 putative structural protein [Erwinia phage pEa_SNUABM_47]QOI72524.1 putative structural protein [Erwinia phage pEa_SNUABM_50]QXO11656.1 hypothetical protein pEaSNUABM19_00545 [Erwinia phage pEa_SNUABM_19]QXO12205.1 hypothetical protein pEaSNUABM44_00544 [Erwinia phage pEa_SNUABM_44]QXO12761.1 hypothetical protein pEaSNUABM49_00548 [Erwinia phage pEa_SNUABM_49]